jgi:hypothetical protein
MGPILSKEDNFKNVGSRTASGGETRSCDATSGIAVRRSSGCRLSLGSHGCQTTRTGQVPEPRQKRGLGVAAITAALSIFDLTT